MFDEISCKSRGGTARKSDEGKRNGDVSQSWDFGREGFYYLIYINTHIIKVLF